MSRFILTAAEDAWSTGNHTALQTVPHQAQFILFKFKNGWSGIISRRRTESVFLLPVCSNSPEDEKCHSYFFIKVIVMVVGCAVA